MIRKAQSSDCQKLASLWLESSLVAHNFIPQDYWLKMQKSVQRDYLPNTESYVFEDKHKIKGFISVLENNFIGALFVAPEYQRKKIGQKLLTYIRRHRSNISLKVFCKNRQALAFYQQQNFKIISTQTDPSTGEEELILSWAVGCLSGFQKRHQGDS